MKAFICECGKAFPAGTRNNVLTNHRKSVLHRHGREVAKLLRDPLSIHCHCAPHGHTG